MEKSNVSCNIDATGLGIFRELYWQKKRILFVIKCPSHFAAKFILGMWAMKLQRNGHRLLWMRPRNGPSPISICQQKRIPQKSAIHAIFWGGRGKDAWNIKTTHAIVTSFLHAHISKGVLLSPRDALPV